MTITSFSSVGVAKPLLWSSVLCSNDVVRNVLEDWRTARGEAREMDRASIAAMVDVMKLY
jgi:hypothetical protein